MKGEIDLYICKPERNVFQTKLLVTVCVIVTSALFLVSTLINQYASLVQLCGYLSLMVSILLCVRYSLTEFEYSVNGCDFSVIKVIGNKRQIICNVALETAIDLIEKRDYDHLPSSEKAIIKYSLNQNMKTKSYVFLCCFNGKRAMIEFEPNEAFVSIMKNQIAVAKKNLGNED